MLCTRLERGSLLALWVAGWMEWGTPAPPSLLPFSGMQQPEAFLGLERVEAVWDCKGKYRKLRFLPESFSLQLETALLGHMLQMGMEAEAGSLSKPLPEYGNTSRVKASPIPEYGKSNTFFTLLARLHPLRHTGTEILSLGCCARVSGNPLCWNQGVEGSGELAFFPALARASSPSWRD